jgi:transposase InsO family protein
VPRESSPLDLVHSDVCGPMRYQSLGGASYFVTFIDDATRKVWAYPTRTKDRVFTIFREWLVMVENQTDRKLKSLRSDNGGEYKSDKFVQFCRERGIRREFTAPHSPEQNGVTERMNRTIHERIVSMLHHSGLSDGFWAEALLTAVHIINMSPSRLLGSKIPQELWTQRKPDYDKLRIFGCEAYALVPKDDRRKLESRSRKCIFLVYGPDGSFSYRLWDPKTHHVV